jgi:hypothetical protein
MNGAHTYAQMEERLWHQTYPPREYSQMLCTWVNCLMKFAHLHVVPLVVPKFQLRMNVLMRPSRMNISDSFVKTFSPVQRQLISLFFLILFVFFQLAFNRYRLFVFEYERYTKFFFTSGDSMTNHIEICLQAACDRSE